MNDNTKKVRSSVFAFVILVADDVIYGKRRYDNFIPFHSLPALRLAPNIIQDVYLYLLNHLLTSGTASTRPSHHQFR